MARLADARRQAVVRLDDPALRRAPLRRVADQPAASGYVGRHARSAGDRRDLPRPVEVRPGDPPGPVAGARPPARRRPAPARVRRDHLRAPGRRPAPPAGAAARACEPDRHAVVPEDRRPPAGAVHRPGDRGLALDRRLRDPRPVDRSRTDPRGVPGRAAAGVRPPAVGRGGARRARAARPAAGRSRRRDHHPAHAVEGQPVLRGGRTAGAGPRRRRALLHRGRGRAAGGARRAGAGAGIAGAPALRRLRARRRPRRWPHSTSRCSRRCGRGRR